MDENHLLVEGIGRAWSDAQPLVSSDVEKFESQLLVALRELDAVVECEGDIRKARDEVRAVIRQHPRLDERLAHEFDILLLEAERGPHPCPPEMPRAIKHERYLDIPVLYGTDRESCNTSDLKRRYGGERGPLSFGMVNVSVPDDHRIGRIEKPRRWRLQFRAESGRHVLLSGLEPLDQIKFTMAARTMIDVSARAEALVFVHGYRVSFAQAARRAAQLAYDLQFEGLPTLYSWPSEGRALRYTVDEENVRWTLPHFRQFIQLTSEATAGTVHIIAHSMGNRVLAEALGNLTEDANGRLGHVVFAAPDIDAAIFRELASSFTRGTGRRTLYASSKDQALRLSRKLAKYPRAGQSGAEIVVIDGVDTIDATTLDTGLVNHSYFGDHTSVISDIYAVLRHGHPPGQRFGLRRVPHRDGCYWVFAPRR